MTALLALAFEPTHASYGPSEAGGTLLVLVAVLLASGALPSYGTGRCYSLQSESAPQHGRNVRNARNTEQTEW